MTDFDVVTWATLIGTWTLVVGTLAFAYWQLRQAQRLHSATTILDLRERYFNPRLRHARRVLAVWLLAGEPRGDLESWEVGVFFEFMGHLTRGGVLEKRMVWSAFGTWVTSYYTLLTQPVNLLKQWRDESHDPLIFGDFEWLAQQLIVFERRLSPGYGSGGPTLAEAREILESESHLDALARD